MTDKIYNEDCLEGMKRIPDGVVDFVLTDLPFGTTNCRFDKRIDLEKFWEQIKRVTKHNAAIALFAQMPFAVDLVNANRKMFRYEWIWKKTTAAGFFNANKMPLRCHEQILIFYRALPTYNPQKEKAQPYKRKHKDYNGGIYRPLARIETINEGDRYPLDVIFFNTITIYNRNIQRQHPMQKPTELLEYLIKTYTNEGELVLDATIGSGSTTVAAINTGRHFIGFETEKKFYDIANERIAKAYEEKAMRLME